MQKLLNRIVESKKEVVKHEEKEKYLILDKLIPNVKSEISGRK